MFYMRCQFRPKTIHETTYIFPIRFFVSLRLGATYKAIPGCSIIGQCHHVTLYVVVAEIHVHLASSLAIRLTQVVFGLFMDLLIGVMACLIACLYGGCVFVHA